MSLTKSFSGIEATALEEKITEAFKSIGFGVLHTIDFQETLKQKISEDVGYYKQLQICNPKLAFEAIKLDPTIGLQLPCNVMVRKSEDGLTVDVQSPLESIPGNSPEALKAMANELTDKIEAMLNEL